MRRALFPGSKPWLVIAAAICSLTALPLRADWTFSDPTEPAAPFPKDHPAAAYPEYKIYDAQNNPVRVPKEDWTGAAARVASDPEWSKWLRLQRAELDDWMATRQDKPEWICGWAHDGESPKDASRVIFTPDEPILGTYALHSDTDPKILVTPKLHGWWVNAFRGRHVRYILEAAQMYRLTGEKKYADWAAGQLDFYADNYLKWPLDNPVYRDHNESRLSGQSLDDAVIFVDFINTARILGDYVTPDRMQHWIDALFKPEAALLEKSSVGKHIQNMACWIRAADGMIALYSNDADLWKQVLDAPYGIHDQIGRGVTSDYLWYEQSFGYNFYVVKALNPFFSYALMEGRGAELQDDMASVENLLFTPAAMRFSTGRDPIPADGGSDAGKEGIDLLNDAAPIYPTKTGAYDLAHEKSWTALLDPPDPATVPPQPQQPSPVTSHNFESTRMAVIRNDSWQVFFHYGQLTRFHAEPDVLNFEAFYKDTDVTHNAGNSLYGAAMFKEYYATPISHNVPLIDGAGQAQWNQGQLDSFSDTSVAASDPQYQPKAQASRTVTIDGESLKDTVAISTSDGNTHALGFLLHLNGKVALPANFVDDPNPEKIQPSSAFKYWKKAARATFHDRASFDVSYGTVTMHLDFELPGDFTVWHASVPDQPTHRREVLYIQTQGTAATLNTTFQPATSVGAQSG